jgi:hypothetical protein
MAASNELCKLSLKLPRIESTSREHTPLSVTELKEDAIPTFAPPCIDRTKKLLGEWGRTIICKDVDIHMKQISRCVQISVYICISFVYPLDLYIHLCICIYI